MNGDYLQIRMMSATFAADRFTACLFGHQRTALFLMHK